MAQTHRLCLLVAALSLASLAQVKPKPAEPTATAQSAVPAALALADRHAGEGRLNLAREGYEKVIRLGGRAQIASDFVRSRNLGLCYLNGTPQNLANAADWLGRAHALRPAVEETHLLYAQALGWSKQYDASAANYRALMTAHPAASDYAIGLSNVLNWKGDVDGSLAALDRFLQFNPGHREIRLLYARQLSFSKRFTDALGQYQAVLASDPNNAAALTGIAKVTAWQGNSDLALDLYNKVLQKYPNYHDALVGKAFALMWLERKNEARQLFAVLRQRSPDDKEIAAALKALGPAPVAVVARAETKPAAPTPAAPVFPVPEVAPVQQARAAAPVPEPGPPPPPTKEQQVQVLLAKAETASGATNYTSAIHHYHQALALDPGNVTAQWQIARVLSWAKSYEDSITEYQKLLVGQPENLAARTEKARVLSWAKRFDESLLEYELALTQSTSCAGAACTPPEREIRVEYARVLSWAKRYDDALQQYSRLVQPEGALTEADRAVVVEQGRVLAWSRRYTEAESAYDRAINAGGDTFEARLGKAQVLYWSGQVRPAAIVLRQLRAERPMDPTTSLTLAAVEHNLGYNARALTLLGPSGKDAESDNLRRDIRAALRPLVQFYYGFENDDEVAGAGATTVTKMLRYRASVQFYIHPDVRMELVNTVTNGLSSNPALAKHSANEWANETLLRASFRATHWMNLTVGAGGGVTGGHVLQAKTGKQQQFVFDVHSAMTRDRLRVDLSLGRHLAEYTPLAIDNNVVQTRFTAAATYNLMGKHRLGIEYWHGLYSVNSPDPSLRQKFSAHGNGGTIYAMPTWYRDERVTVEAGMRFDSFGFDDGARQIAEPLTGIGSAGFFTPRIYQGYAGEARINWTPVKSFAFAVGGTFGPQRLFGFPSLAPPPPSWGTTGSFHAEAGYQRGSFRTALTYDYFSTETPASPGLQTGAYKSHIVGFRFSKRF